MQAYTGEFDNGRYAILVKDAGLYWRYVDGTEYILTTLSRDLFGFDDDYDYRVKIIRDDNDKVTGFSLLLRSGGEGKVRVRTGDL